MKVAARLLLGSLLALQKDGFLFANYVLQITPEHSGICKNISKKYIQTKFIYQQNPSSNPMFCQRNSLTDVEIIA